MTSDRVNMWTCLKRMYHLITSIHGYTCDDFDNKERHVKERTQATDQQEDSVIWKIVKLQLILIAVCM